MLLQMTLVALMLHSCSANDCSVCIDPLGMESKNISDLQITASASIGNLSQSRARLNLPGNGWAAPAQNNQWLQIDLLKDKVVTRIATQGFQYNGSDLYVKTYSIQHRSNNSIALTDYDGGNTFSGNSGVNMTKSNVFDPPIIARYIRVLPKSWNDMIGMKIELYGCDGIEGIITIDDKGSIYGNGRYMGDDNGEWRIAQSFMFPFDIDVVAIHVVNTGGPGRLLASFSNGVQTDTQWKCANTLHANWNTTNFDDSSWPNGVLYTLNGNTVAGLPTDSVRWMATATLNAPALYCRRNIADFRCHVASPKLESRGPAVITVERTVVKGFAVDIRCCTADGDALQTVDYFPRTSLLNFTANGTNTTKFQVQIKDDKVVEPKQIFRVTCSPTILSPRFAVSPSCTNMKVNIIDDDTYIYFCPSRETSIKEDGGPYVVRLCRVGVISATHTVELCRTTEANTVPSIKAGCDIITFLPNDVMKSHNITITDDIKGELEFKRFTIFIKNNDSAVTFNGSTSYNVTLQDNDNTFFFQSMSLVTANEDSGDVNVTINRVGQLSVQSTVRLSLVFSGNAVSADCTGTSPRDITFKANETTKTVTACTIVDDKLVEPDETFKIKIQGVGSSNVRIGSFQKTVKIISDDVNITCSNVNLQEADGPAVMAISREGATSSTNNTITCTTQDSSATQPSDYTQTSENVTFALNVLSKNFSVPIKDDRIGEENENLTVTCTTSDVRVNLISCNNASIDIINDDINVYCPKNIGVQRAFEDQSPVLIEFTREGSTQYNHTIRIRTVAGTAHSGSDFVPIDKVLTFVSGQKSIEQNVTFVKDNNVEPVERFRLNVTSSDNRVNVLCRKIDFMIKNDDTFIRCANSTISVSEGTKKASFVLKREGAMNKSSPIWYSTVDGTAYDKADYKPVIKKNATFQPGQEYMTLSVEIVNDQVNEKDQTFAVVIGSHVSTTLTSSSCTKITINDDDEARISAKQAQELLKERQRVAVFIAVAIGLVVAVLVVMLILVLLLYRVLHR